MQVRVNIAQQGMNINEVFEGATADEVVGKMKDRVQRELPFALRLFVGGMSRLAFAQEVVKRYNDSQKTSLPIPASCDEFLTLAQAQGFAKLESQI